jgi:hypothetical protein
MIRRLAGVGAVVGALAVCPGAVAAVPDPVAIGPNQAFLGSVNDASSNAEIQMACFGPVRPGEVGHPFSGQSLEVELASSASAGPFGFTGDAHEIDATFALPSAAGSTSELLAKFSSYYVVAAISTGAVFPCYGHGDIAFTPVAGGPLARPWNVEVTFVGQP